MFTTNTKGDAEYSSFETVKEIRANVDIPFVLIGGISLENVDHLIPLNADGYSVISSILKADDIYNQTKKWITKIN